MKRRIKKALAMMLVFAMMIPLVGCNQTNMPQGTEDSMDFPVDEKEATDEMKAASMDFAVRLLQASLEQPPMTDDYAEIQMLPPNVLLSPISVYMALAMTTNGANGDTLTELEEALGLSREELNSYAYQYLENLSSGEDYKLSMANSIWYTDDEKFTVKDTFVQEAAQYYSAGVYAKSFQNPATVSEINAWVETNTDGYIKEIINDISDDTVMILVNALAFEAKWENPYADSDIKDGIFTMEDGATQTVYFMNSEENLYLEDDKATGFIKYYADKKYAFVALLPNEGVGVNEYILGLNGAHLQEMIENPTEIKVYASIPQFEIDYQTELVEVFESMGVNAAFHYETADFTNLGEYKDENIFIDNILHKTYLEVNQDGTKGGASTAVIMDSMGAVPNQEESKTVRLDRPFIYMIIDCENNQPIFMGTLMYGTYPVKCGTAE